MLNYPNSGNKLRRNKNINYNNRGMNLEDDINLSNDYYNSIKRANIHKKPTPIQIVKVDYPQRNKAKITEAYFKIPSTTDYNGIYRGKYIDYEAKETNLKTTYPLVNIHKHQIDHLKDIIDLGGIGFLILRMNYHQETYIIKGEDIINIYYNSEKKSINYDKIKEVGHLIAESYQPRLNYLDVIDKIYFGGNL